MNVTVRTENIDSVTMGIKMTEETGQLIFYTLDGTDPDNTSTLYTEVIKYPSCKLIKAIAYDGGSVF